MQLGIWSKVGDNNQKEEVIYILGNMKDEGKVMKGEEVSRV